MADKKKNFASISIPKNLYERIDKVYEDYQYNTKAGLIEDCLRRAVERMEARIRNGTIPNNGNGGSRESGEEKK